MDTTNRREFLRGAASVGAFAVAADAAQLHTGSDALPLRVRAWRTTKDQKFQPIDWNLLLDENGRPDISIPPRPFQPGGLVCMDTKSRRVTRSGSYCAFSHYSKTIKRGAHIFASTGELPGIAHVAAENADGSRVLVMGNDDSVLEQRVQCTLASHALNVVLPPDSITSFVWS